MYDTITGETNDRQKLAQELRTALQDLSEDIVGLQAYEDVAEILQNLDDQEVDISSLVILGQSVQDLSDVDLACSVGKMTYLEEL